MEGCGLGADRRVKIARGGAMEQEGPVQMETTWGEAVSLLLYQSIHTNTGSLLNFFFFEKGNV